MTQVTSAPATTFAAAKVTTVPEKEPKVPVFPVVALLASVQLVAVMAYPAGGVSVTVTLVPIAVMLVGEGEAGPGVASAEVVTDGGFEAKLIWTKLNGPPNPPKVIFCNLKVGIFVSTMAHAMVEPETVAAASKVMVPAAKLGVAVPPVPRPEQEAPVIA